MFKSENDCSSSSLEPFSVKAFPSSATVMAANDLSRPEWSCSVTFCHTTYSVFPIPPKKLKINQFTDININIIFFVNGKV